MLHVLMNNPTGPKCTVIYLLSPQQLYASNSLLYRRDATLFRKLNLTRFGQNCDCYDQFCETYPNLSLVTLKKLI